MNFNVLLPTEHDKQARMTKSTFNILGINLIKPNFSGSQIESNVGLWIGKLKKPKVRQDTLVLWYNVSCIRPGGQGFKPCHYHLLLNGKKKNEETKRADWR